MQRFSTFILAVLLFCTAQTFAQTATISGTITDGSSGETLIGATVYATNLEIGTSTNVYGFYSLQIPTTDSVKLLFSYTGFPPVIKTILVTKNQKLDIELSAKGLDLKEIVVSAESVKEEVNSSQMSVTTLSMAEAKALPALFGEVDIIKTLQLKPGIQSGGEGQAGIHVRGGGYDQNLVLLDEAVVYNASHLFGFFSTFNSDAVKDVKLYKGGFPAEYGGRLSSIIDVRLKEGNKKKFSGSGGLGLIASRLTLEGPIVKDKGSFIVSGRRTYVDIFTRMINKRQVDNENFNPIPDYFFYDLNVKANYKVGENDRIFLSGYFGRDIFGFNDADFDFDFVWGNTTGTLRWNHIFNEKLFSNTTLTYSDYQYNITNKFDIFTFEVGSGISDYTAKTDFFYSPDNRHNIRFGLSAIYHTFDIGRLELNSTDNSVNFDAGTDLNGTEGGAYISDDFEINDALTINGGLRLSGFTNDGNYYGAIEPRFALKYSVSENVSLKTSYTNMAQYLHLVSNSAASLPTDIWYPSDSVVKPQRSHQVAAGINWAINDDWILSNEVYYKWLRNQIDFKDGAQLFVNPNLSEEFVFGNGWSYGNEIYLEKKRGKLKGWVGYTLAWSWRKFPDILDGRKYAPRYDRRHDISVVLMYDISRRWTVTGTWVYNTGNAVSLPAGRIIVQDIEGQEFTIIPLYLERNSFRMPAYHRMDLGVVCKFFPKWGESDITASVYNAYDRRNPFFIYFETLEDENEMPTGFAAKQVSLFPVLPSVTWNFKF